MTTMVVLMMSLLIGMRHALESDHLAAVASLATRSPSLRHTIRLGATWGLGHSLTLFLFGTVVIWMDRLIPERIAEGLESIVGIMLILLGLDVLQRAWRERIHFHVSRHEDGTMHLHAPSHGNPGLHNNGEERPGHLRGLPLRALLVGMIHGMAGSAALILLTLQTLDDPWLSMLYMLVFGFGSILGMAVISTVIALPLRITGRRLTWMHGGLQAGIGLFTLVSGVSICLPLGRLLA